eukprot:Blabericola_migrator_1__3837@NODE_2156_length_3192_cov_49_846080_g1363_i0_p3_GENE_NODE_2156_length_3192_cov_49_846080_g1363_i0NODE_2156_length_3192_cov_49_846080_g1363_i0_p3_ORF_typecomplete_len100_score5_59ASRT/PF07100_11/0_0075_NODE_2156_length_3192_cov_49_846080_g1363_i09121211
MVNAHCRRVSFRALDAGDNGGRLSNRGPHSVVASSFVDAIVQHQRYDRQQSRYIHCRPCPRLLSKGGVQAGSPQMSSFSCKAEFPPRNCQGTLESAGHS